MLAGAQVLLGQLWSQAVAQNDVGQASDEELVDRAANAFRAKPAIPLAQQLQAEGGVGIIGGEVG